MKRTFFAIFLLLLGTAGCGVNLEWLPDPKTDPFKNTSGNNLTSQYTVTSFGNISGSNISGALTKTFTPSGIAIDPNVTRNAVYVADEVNNRVLKFRRDGTFLTSEFADDLAGVTTGGIAVSGSGEVYLADTVNKDVRRYNNAGDLLGIISVDVGESLALGLGDIAISGDSLNLYVTFPASNLVRKVPIENGPPESFSSVGFNSPKGIAVNGSSVFISNSGTGTISKRDLVGVSQDGGSFGSFGTGFSQLSEPLGIAADTSKVYVADSNNKRIQVYNVFGQYLGFIGRFGTNSGEFSKPLKIAVDSSGNLYVAEANRIQKFTKN